MDVVVEWIMLYFGENFVAAYILFLVYNTIIVAAVYKGWFCIRKKPVLFGIGGIVLLSPIWLTGLFLIVGKMYQKERILAFLGIGENMGYQLEICRKMLAGSSVLNGNPEFHELLTMSPAKIQVVVFIAENTGIINGFDTYCPFLGTGRSGMLTSYILLGILLSIYRYQNTAPERKFQYGKNKSGKKKILPFATML